MTREVRAQPFTPRGLSSPLGAVGVALGLGLVAFPAALLAPIPLLAAGTVVVLLVLAVVVHPPVAAYVLITVTPLVAGLGRSSLVPVLRPHEALAVVVVTGLALHGLTRSLTGGVQLPRWRALDSAMVLMAITGSVLPLLWLLARGRTPTMDDVLYSMALWKFYGVFVIVRLSVRSPQEIRRCLWLSMAAGCVVALLAALQSLELWGVPDLMSSVYPTEDPEGASTGRGSSTLGSSIVVGDVMAFNLAIALGWLFAAARPPRVLLALATVFFLGGLASGQFSGAIALAVSVTTVAALTGRLRRLAVVVLPAVILGALLLRPVIGRRLGGFDSTTGLPQSWDVRLVNLSTYFWPELFGQHAYLLGVRPAARIEAPEPWRDYVYIESGYTWLLWAGGLPLLGAFVVFVVVALRQTVRVARIRTGERAAAGVAAAAAVVCTVVLMALDPHLVMRGAGDLLFTLLALSVASDPGSGPPRPSGPAGAPYADRMVRRTGTAPATVPGGSA